MYLHNHWELLQKLRAALRTEPNVTLAILFGSTAVGADHEDSDLDILVALKDPAVRRMADLAGRLTRRLDREVQLVRLKDAESSPVLMSAILKEGRTLIDREQHWGTMQADTPKWQRHARRIEHPPAETTESLVLDQSAFR